MMVCGACERELTEDLYSGEHRVLRPSIRRCMDCVAGGNQLVLLKKGRTRPEEDECPLCSLPLPLDSDQSSSNPCCLKLICNGCLLAAMKRSSNMGKCPFCRTPASDNDQQIIAMMQKRVDAGDPKAMLNLGNQYSCGNFGLVKDVRKSLQLCERAADLGLKDAHYRLGFVYHFGVALRRTRPRRPGI
mmetsp:Transcript_38393/g.86442  ORF Transcript_38393/g.86442 Transcript_38393/m.86442 type:complete len:188 (-) Transcript_38393:480-1043(-)